MKLNCMAVYTFLSFCGMKCFGTLPQVTASILLDASDSLMIIIKQYKLNHEGATNKGSIIQQIVATKERSYRNFTYQKGSAVFGCIYPSRRFVLDSIFCLRSVSFWKN